MKTAIAYLKSTAPYQQSKHYNVPKLQGENPADYERRTWRERLHVDGKENVFIPPMAFKNCLSDAAKYLSIQIPGKGKSTYTKHIEAGVLVVEPLTLPMKKDEVPENWIFVPADGKRGGSKRVEKCFPIIHQWEGEVPFLIFDEVVLNEYERTDGRTVSALEHIIVEAGKFVGIGSFRPRNNGYFGRFKVESVRIE